ncbi:MAG: MG2 domain-containing protein [Bilophila wadsworthia]
MQEGVIALKRTDPGVPQFTVLDVAPLFKDGRGLMRIELVGMDGDKEVVSASRFLLVTDLDDCEEERRRKRDVFVCSLSEGNPIFGAAVHILGTNGLPVAEAVTDAGGRAALPSVSGLNREKRPVAVTVSVKRGADEDAAWLPLDDYSRVVDYSRFPTQGQTSNADGINAYVFSERGIFRPGETLRFGMLMRRGDWKALPPDMPFFAELSDPSERTILRRQFIVGADGLAELSWTVPEGAPTGRYRLDVQTPNADGFAVVSRFRGRAGGGIPARHHEPVRNGQPRSRQGLAQRISGLGKRGPQESVWPARRGPPPARSAFGAARIAVFPRL